ncbi:leucine zipper domain-containing protein [Streptomyces nigra]|uniref:Leucine zipper domain-containing protein n=1 Tax=Streptomyces nigra TaxID=1827580 RepID=A0ABZ1J9A8_9ACTN
MSHRNARLTVHGRRLLVERVRSGRPVAVSQPPAHGASVIVSTRPASGPPRSRTITVVPPSGGKSPASPLGGPRHRADSNRAPATSVPAPPPG